MYISLLIVLTHFLDPKPVMRNGRATDDDMSPPPKKPSPSMMMPLTGTAKVSTMNCLYVLIVTSIMVIM